MMSSINGQELVPFLKNMKLIYCPERKQFQNTIFILLTQFLK